MNCAIFWRTVANALSAVDILHNRMPLDSERRARAFAGEFLLPGREAARIWTEADSPNSVEALKDMLKRLCVRFGVTPSVAAWKLDHGLKEQDVDINALLDAIVPQR